jgi:hypothetical protein
MKRFLFLFITSCALANDTAIHDGGDGPAPLGDRRGPESVVRMVRERLDISFGRKETAVRATFVFLNTKRDAPARQSVGFPDITAMTATESYDGADFNGPIKDLVTLVNGRERKSRQLRGRVNHRDGIDEPAPPGEKGEFERIWHAIDVEFPVGQEVIIERRYRVSNGSSVAATPEMFFQYTTATGGVWKGTIGEMIAAVSLQDGLTVDSLLWKAAPGSGISPARQHWRVQSPTKMELIWKDFEPRTDSNRRSFRIARPLTPD